MRPEYTERILPFIGQSIIKVITGQRRVGKSLYLGMPANNPLPVTRYPSPYCKKLRSANRYDPAPNPLIIPRACGAI